MPQLPLRATLLRVVPACFVVGASMEFFMVKTGFYDIVTNTEMQRREEAAEQRRIYVEQRAARKRAKAEAAASAGGEQAQ